MPIWGFILGTIFFSIMFTWIYNNTGRSILAVLLHTTGNLS
ncbi:CPBP family intramembrane metalloprotease [Candidatus Aerophobetes bacterium]|nr:CPBP family intramembrane metalloprotease [Candidatus Aerophobetes bacterium]